MIGAQCIASHAMIHLKASVLSVAVFNKVLRTAQVF